MLIYKGLLTLVIILVAILSSTPLMTDIPDKKNIIKPKTTPKKSNGTHSTSSKINQVVATTFTVNKKKLIIERKEEGKATITSCFILNAEGQLIEDDQSEGQIFTSIFGIKAQESPLEEVEAKPVSNVSNDNTNQTPLERVSHTIFQNYDSLTDRCVHLFTQTGVSDQLRRISEVTSEMTSAGTPESISFSRHNHTQFNRFIHTTC